MRCIKRCAGNFWSLLWIFPAQLYREQPEPLKLLDTIEPETAINHRLVADLKVGWELVRRDMHVHQLYAISLWLLMLVVEGGRQPRLPH